MIAILAIALLVLILGLTNYVPGAYLTGWDNLHSEFYPTMNLQRAVFTAWQEYQGTGLLGGMGHGSDLFRQLLLLPLIAVLPNSDVRYVWTLLTLFLGGTGMYLLLSTFLFPHEKSTKHNVGRSFSLFTPRTYAKSAYCFLQAELGKLTIPKYLFSFLGALFYILNLATLQTYYVPFEVFTTHFAALPWLLLTMLLYLRHRSKKHLILFAITLLLSTPQGYVPTIFVVYLIAILTAILTYFLPPFSFTRLKYMAKQTAPLFALIFTINAFWLLPFVYFTLTNSQVNVNAKINQMATETIFLANKEFGTPWDVALLRGFWFSNVEPNLQNAYAYMLAPWKIHLENPFVTILGYAFFAVILYGIFVAIQKKKKILLIPVALFALTFLLLTIAVTPFSWVNDLLRNVVPLFNQVFRFPFTKFSLLASFAYAMLFSLGVSVLFTHLHRNFPHVKAWIVTLVVTICFVFYMLPAFQGQLFYEREQRTIPKEYFNVFSFFKTQDSTTRIANFPQHTFWSWNYYRWGYTGSGFLWYGIKQPILDRAFDVWGKTNEQYYFEVAHALYAKDVDALERVFEKYDVTWILVDNSVYSLENPRSIFLPELQSLLSNSTKIKKAKQFGFLDVYHFTPTHQPVQFIQLYEEILPTINNYNWNNNDQAYKTHGEYIAIETTQKATASAYTYPFRTLFSGKQQQDKTFTLKETPDALVLTYPLIKDHEKTIVTIPSFTSTEKRLPVRFFAEPGENNTITITGQLLLPKVSLNKKVIWGEEQTLNLYAIEKTIASPVTLNINGVTSYTIDLAKITKRTALGTTFLPLEQDTFLVLSDKTKTITTPQSISLGYLQSLPGIQQESSTVFPTVKANDTITVTVPKVTDAYGNLVIDPTKNNNLRNCDTFRKGTTIVKTHGSLLTLDSSNTTACIAFDSLSLSHEEGYAIFIQTQNTKGRGLHFWILNEDEKYPVLDTYFDRQKTMQTLSYILAPQEAFGTGYSFHFDNISVGNDKTINTLGSIAIYPLPYQFITEILLSTDKKDLETIGRSSLTSNFVIRQAQRKTMPVTVTHPNESLYTVSFTATNTKSKTLVLSQAYSNGWQAYRINNTIPRWLASSLPFLVGERLSNHVAISNWKNGWIVEPKEEEETQIVLVYLPQYLQYSGFLLLGATVITLGFIAMKKRRKTTT